MYLKLVLHAFPAFPPENNECFFLIAVQQYITHLLTFKLRESCRLCFFPGISKKFATQHFSSSPPNWKFAASGGNTGADTEGDKVGELCVEPRGDHVGDAKGDANGELKSLSMVALGWGPTRFFGKGLWISCPQSILEK